MFATLKLLPLYQETFVRACILANVPPKCKRKSRLWFAILRDNMGVKEAFLGRLLANSGAFSDEQIVQTVNLLIEHAVKHHASDIHLEPYERFIQVRYRIDNTLRSVHKLPLAAWPAVLTQLKELAGIPARLEHLPQEGAYASLVGEEQFEIQVYTMPVIGGEKAVLHITRRLIQPLDLVDLGFWGSSLANLQHTLTYTHGLILVVTPRRNGKTTTMHSLLHKLSTPAVSIATVENAIEYRLPGASQTQVRPHHGISFYDGLRAALNQDPDIVLVSNVMDKPTIDTVVEAAVGGHLVLAGGHADNAVAGLAYMRTMSDEPFLFVHAVRAAISQRLVRKLCSHCRTSYTPTPEELQSIKKAFGIDAALYQRIHKLEKEAVSAGIGPQVLLTSSTGIQRLWQAHEEGCEACHYSGYQGSVAVVEVLPTTTTNMQSTLLSTSLADKIKRAALKEDFIPMELDGLIKALRGQTTLTEILRAFAL